MRIWTLSNEKAKVVGISIKRKTLETIPQLLRLVGLFFFIMLCNLHRRNNLLDKARLGT